MTDVEKIRKIFRAYYKRDEETGDDCSNFFFYDGDIEMNSFYKAISEIEEKTGKKFPVQYKAFIKAGCGMGMIGKNGRVFNAYSKDDVLYFHNLYKDDKYYQKLAKCLVIGQDDCDAIYFMDVNNIFGYGTDCIWSCEMPFSKDSSEILAYSFIEFLEKLSNKEDLLYEKPFKNCYDLPYNLQEEKDAYEILQAKIKTDPNLLEKTESDKRYVDEILLKLASKGFCHSKGLQEKHEYLKRIQPVLRRFENPVSLEFLSLYDYLGNGFSIDSGQLELWISFTGMDEYYYDDEYVCEDLKKMLLIGNLSGDIFPNVIADVKGFPYLFMDVNNILGHGSKVIYAMQLWAESINEAFIIADDYKDLIKKFYEEEIEDILINHGVVLSR